MRVCASAHFRVMRHQLRRCSQNDDPQETISLFVSLRVLRVIDAYSVVIRKIVAIYRKFVGEFQQVARLANRLSLQCRLFKILLIQIRLPNDSV